MIKFKIGDKCLAVGYELGILQNLECRVINIDSDKKLYLVKLIGHPYPELVAEHNLIKIKDSWNEEKL